MLKKIISKICLCFFLVFIFSVNTGCKKRVDENRLISASEWIVNSYNEKVISYAIRTICTEQKSIDRDVIDLTPSLVRHSCCI